MSTFELDKAANVREAHFAVSVNNRQRRAPRIATAFVVRNPTFGEGDSSREQLAIAFSPLGTTRRALSFLKVLEARLGTTAPKPSRKAPGRRFIPR